MTKVKVKVKSMHFYLVLKWYLMMMGNPSSVSEKRPLLTK